MFMRLFFFMPSLRAGVFLPDRWKFSFQLSGSDAFCQTYLHFLSSKTLFRRLLLTNLSTPAKWIRKAVAYVYAAIFLYALVEGGSFLPGTLKIFFSTVREWRVLPNIYTLLSSKTLFRRLLLTNLSTPAKWIRKTVAYVYAAVFFMPSERAGVFLPDRWKIFFNCPGVTRFAKHIYTFVEQNAIPSPAPYKSLHPSHRWLR